MRFSQRKGLEPVKTALQVDSMDNDLRTALWNAFYLDFFGPIESSQAQDLRYHSELNLLLIRLWVGFFKRQIDKISNKWRDNRDFLQDYFFKFPWNRVYDFIEFVANACPDEATSRRFQEDCNHVLEMEMSAYRFAGGNITQITDEEEIKEIEEALGSGRGPVETHMSQALQHLSNRETPDYRNSIKESISAVEAMCRTITGTAETLGDALKHIEGKTKAPLHPALKEAFSRLYGWTSDAGGIRHAIAFSDDNEVRFEDAKFMLVACSAFINYLKVKNRS